MTVTKKYITFKDDYATGDNAGVIKVGEGLAIAEGTLTAVPPDDATTTSKGIVQVGSGLSITNGVLSVAGGASVNIPHISYTNNEGFAVGLVTSTSSAQTKDVSAVTMTTSYKTLCSVYPFSQACTYQQYPPFYHDATIDDMIGSIEIEVVYKGKTGASNGYIEAIDANGNVLWESEGLTCSTATERTKTFIVPAPSSCGTSGQITFKGRYHASEGSSSSGFNVLEIRVVAGTHTATNYYDPRIAD